MKRLAAMHDWPLFTTRALTAVCAAASRSAPGMTMNGSLPPSSSTDVLIAFPAAAPTWLPAALLPVRVTAATRGSSITDLTLSVSIRRVWNTPSAKPARRKMSSMARAHWGTLEACLSRPTFPAIKAGAANRKTCQKGKFHGMIASTGPIGWKVT